MNDPKAKQLLKKLVDDLEDLRVNLQLVAHAGKHPMSFADVKDAKSLALEQNKQAYEALRKEIDAL
jgi:hypothetical protein